MAEPVRMTDDDVALLMRFGPESPEGKAAIKRLAQRLADRVDDEIAKEVYGKMTATEAAAKNAPEHYTYKLEVGPSQDWRKVAQAAIDGLKNGIADGGRVAVGAPEMPPLGDGLQGYTTEGLYRVLYMWVPDWSPSQDAGKFMVRVDTLTRKA